MTTPGLAGGETATIAQATPDTITTESPGPAREPSLDASPADTSARPASNRRRPVAPPRSRFDSPRWVMLRSVVLPGWGQAHNGSWIKASAVAVSEAGLVWRLFDDNRALDRLAAEVADAQADGDDEREAILVDRYNARLDAYSGRQWLLGAVFVYSLLDAYIDAHFRGFKTDFQVDPALPEGAPPVVETRIGLRVFF